MQRMQPPSCHAQSRVRMPLGHHRALLRPPNRTRLNQSMQSQAVDSRTEESSQLFDHWYQPSPPVLQRTMSAIKVVSIEGKGRGVVCTRDLSGGDLVMVCEPLALLRQPEGQRLDTEALVDMILEQGKHKHRWIQEYLYDGSAKSIRLVPDLSLRPEEQSAMVQHAAVKRLAQRRGAAEGFSANVRAALAGKKQAPAIAAQTPALDPSAPSEDTQQSPETKAAVVFPGGVDRATALRTARTVKYNCFGDVYEDKPAVHCRGETATAHIGVWPEMSMLNHSCSPNAINYVLGDTMVVRAARDIKAGDEVTISYLGRPQLMPVEQRIEFLLEHYNFNCDCTRCSAELMHIDKVQGHYEDLYDEVTEELGPLFNMAKEGGDLETVLSVRNRLRKLMADLYSVFRKAALNPQVRLFFSASLYDAFELQLACEAVAAEMQQGSTATAAQPRCSSQASFDSATSSVMDQSLTQCAKAVAEVSPGSDLHVMLTSRCLHDIMALNPSSPKAENARRMAVHAHRMRYGPISPELTAKFMELNRTIY